MSEATTRCLTSKSEGPYSQLMQRSFCGKSSDDWVRIPLVSSSDFAKV